MTDYIRANQELYLNVIDAKAGVSLFSWNFREKDGRGKETNCNLEAGLMNALNACCRSLGEEVRLIRHKREFVDGSSMYIDNRISYGDRVMTVLHLSTGSRPAEPLPHDLLDSMEELSVSPPENGTDFFLSSLPEPDGFLLLDRGSPEPLVSYPKERSGFESGIVFTFSNYASETAGRDETVLKDEAVLIRSVRRGEYVDRFLARRDGRVAVATFADGGKGVTDEGLLLDEVGLEVALTFEGEFREAVEAGACEYTQFEPFQKSVWEIILRRHEEVFFSYQAALLKGLEKEGVPEGEMAELKAIARRDPVLLYDKLGQLYERNEFNSEICRATEKTNRRFAPLIDIFQIGAYHHPDEVRT